MARSCGIRIGARRYEIVVLDGGARKHKILAYHTGELPPPVEDAFDESVAVLKAAAKEHRVPRENVHLAVDTGSAAFRRLSLPFSDRNKISQVVKWAPWPRRSPAARWRPPTRRAAARSGR
jgi:hypothetical protein